MSGDVVDYGPWLYGYAFILGAIMGSFVGVIVERLPVMILNGATQLNLAYPGSHCLSCQHPLCWWENIPLLSWLMLRGRCRHCQTAIPLRLLATECICALCFMLCSYLFSNITDIIAGCCVCCLLVALIIIDLRHLLLPDCLTISLLWLGLIYHGLQGDSLVPCVWGAVAGYLFFTLLQYLARWLLKKEGLGSGDSKLLAAAGAWCGWQMLPEICLLAALITLFFALIVIVNNRGKEVYPFGPGLCLSSVVVYFWYSMPYFI